MSHCAHERPQERQQSNRRNSREDWDLEGVVHSLLDLVELADLVLRQLCTCIRETVGPVVHRISKERVNRQLGRRDPRTVITRDGLPHLYLNAGGLEHDRILGDGLEGRCGLDA